MAQLHPPLDFICVGAPKAGTTTLHFLLKKSKEICLPFGKENPILHTKPSQESWSMFVAENYSRKCKGKLGKIDPSYWFVPRFPHTLSALFPDIKIIIILREPVERFISHYKMNVRRGKIVNDIKEYLRSVFSEIEKLRNAQGFSSDIIRASALLSSEYRRIIGEYLQFFPENQILILFIEDFRNPSYLNRLIGEFLGVSPLNVAYIPRRNSGDVSKEKVLLWKTAKALYRLPILRILWKNLMPVQYRKRILTVLGEWMVEHEEGVLIPDSCVAMVREYIHEQNRGLKDIIKRFRSKFPEWVERYG